MSTHTPGPWSYVKNSWSDCTVYGGPDDRQLATLSIESVATEETQDELEATDEANARLMTAAPEMLEALRHIAKTWPDSFAARHARAAIHKATGVA